MFNPKSLRNTKLNTKKKNNQYFKVFFKKDGALRRLFFIFAAAFVYYVITASHNPHLQNDLLGMHSPERSLNRYEKMFTTHFRNVLRMLCPTRTNRRL